MAGSPIQFECVYLKTLRYPNVPPIGAADVVFARLVAAHIEDTAINAQGLVDVLKLQPLARMGCFDYTHVDNRFQMVIPGNSSALLAGLEGSATKAYAARRKRRKRRKGRKRRKRD